MNDNEWIQRFGTIIQRHNGVRLGEISWDTSWELWRFNPKLGVSGLSEADVRCIQKRLKEIRHLKPFP